MDFAGDKLEYIPLAEYAFWRGVDDATIRNKIKRGILPDTVCKKKGHRWFIDKSGADQILEAVNKGRLTERNKTLFKNQYSDKEPTTDEEREDANQKFWDAKSKKEEITLALNQVKLDEQLGKLIKADSVKKTVMKAFGDAKEQLLNIPDQMGPDLLACTDLVDLQTKLHEAINKALAGISDRYGS